MSDIQAVQFNKIEALRTKIDLSLARSPAMEGTLTREIAWVRQGNDVGGGVTIFPIPLFANAAKKRSAYEEVQNTPPVLVNLRAEVSEWAPDGVKIPRGTQLADLYGVFESMAGMVLDLASGNQEAETCRVLGEGETIDHVYDNLKFFATTKYVNPSAQKGQYSNYDGALNLDRAGLIKVFDALDAVPGPDGIIRPMPGEIVVAVSNEDQFDRASVYLNGTIRASSAGTASESNGSLKGRARLIKAPMLRNYNSGKGWYAFKVVNGMYRPLMMSVAEPPTLHVEGLNPNEHSRVTRNIINMGWRGFYGVDPAFGQYAYKAVEK